MDMTDHHHLKVDNGLFHKLPTSNSMTLLKSLYEECIILIAVPLLANYLPD